MQEGRKKFGMELLPSLHKRLKAAALQADIPLWAATQQAIEAYLADAEGSSAPPQVVQLPNLLDGLSEEDRAAVTALVDICRSESQSSLVRVLRFALRLAATEHTATQGKRKRKSDTVISDTLSAERKQSS